MKLSVVVPVYNGGEELRVCLAAIVRSSRKPEEIIVADDGSTDGATKCAAELSARVISVGHEPHGPARARNQGAARASGDLLVFVDADVEVHADTLERFERAFTDDPGLAAAFGSYDDEPSAPGTVSRFKNLLHHFVHQHGMRDAETFWAGCGAIRREVFAALAGFSESYQRPSVEDIELGARLRAAGHRIALCPEIQCTHRKRWSLASLLRTDIFARAVPWTRLILRQGRLPSGLNTDGKSRWSAVLAGLLALGALLGPLALVSRSTVAALACAGVGASAAAGLVALNRRLYRFFFGHGGLGFGVGAVGLHVLYLLYSSAVFALLLARERLAGGSDVVPGSEGAIAGKPTLPTDRRKRVAGTIICAALFAIYVGDGNPLPGRDATPNVHLAVNLLRHGTLTYTPEANPAFFRWTVAHDGTLRTAHFRSWDERAAGHSVRELLAQGQLRSPVAPYYFSATTKPDVYVSSYGAATGLFALPLVAAVYPFVQDLAERTSLLWFLGKLAAAFAVAGSAWFLFLVAADHLRLATAVILTLAYGLATNVWSVSSQALWQHAPGELFLALGMFCLFRQTRECRRALPDGTRRGSSKAPSRGFCSEPHRHAPTLAGLAFALAFMCRPTNSLAVLAGFAVLFGNRRALLRYCLGALPVALIFFAYNLHYFDKLITFGQVTALASRISGGDTKVLWQQSFASGLAGVLISPSRGLFVYSPILLVSVWGSLRIWKERRWLPLRAAAIAAVGIWLVTARWGGWWGGWSFGYRLVVDTALLLAFLAIPIAEKIRARRGLTVLVGGLLCWSLGVQMLGAVVYDVGGWDGKQGYVVAGAPDSSPGPYFLTTQEAAAYCQSRGCSYRPIVMDSDKPRFRGRLWGIGDSQILHYLRHLKSSRINRIAGLRQFLIKDG